MASNERSRACRFERRARTVQSEYERHPAGSNGKACPSARVNTLRKCIAVRKDVLKLSGVDAEGNARVTAKKARLFEASSMASRKA
eukprot:7254655-Prymnesium_polylepis.1